MKTIVLRPKTIATAIMTLCAVFYLGWMAAAAHFNIAGHWQHDKVIAATVPKLVATAKQAERACEHNAGAALDNDANVTDLSRCPKPSIKADNVLKSLAAK